MSKKKSTPAQKKEPEVIKVILKFLNRDDLYDIGYEDDQIDDPSENVPTKCIVRIMDDGTSKITYE